MKKELLLLLSIITVGTVGLELYADYRINKLINRHGYTKEMIDFYQKYSVHLHHLENPNNSHAKNPTSLMFEVLGSGSTNILIQGDSWAHQYRLNESKTFLSNYLKTNKNLKFILGGTGSYSPSLITSQHNIIKNEFNLDPHYIAAIIDQSDIGDELCRYEHLREVKEGKVIVNPEPDNSFEPYASGNHFENFNMFFSDKPAIYKTIYFFRNFYKTKKLRENYEVKCGRDQILGYLKEGIDFGQKEYMVKVFNDYFNEVFSNKDLKRLVIVTHPHKKHLTKEYKLDITSIIKIAVGESKYQNKIIILPFLKNYEDIKKIDFNEIFVENDAYSHLKQDYFLESILPKVLEKFN